MKAILEFNLPEESQEHYAAVNGDAYRDVIWAMNEWLRQQIKYHGGAELAEARAHLAVLMADAGLED